MQHFLSCLWATGGCSDLQWVDDAYVYTTGFVNIASMLAMIAWISWDRFNADKVP